MARPQQNKVLILFQERISSLGRHLQRFFSADTCSSIDVVAQKIDGHEEPFKVVVFDCIEAGVLDLHACETLLSLPLFKSVPLIVLTGSCSLKDKLKAFEIGCDDFIDSSNSGDEACARVTKSIFHRIANDQLASRLKMATETARNAMVGNSDLGANIQFLLAVHCCDNLDQLGQQFFATIARYGLRCSLQMRSAMSVKNMEAHGMAKDLESQLLTQLAESSRYIDFGTRTIINYDKVSLLVKNMPIDDPDKYGAIKDNTFSLLQGLNARILALEDKYRLLEEKELLRKLSSDVYAVMDTIKDSYQRVMCEIVNEVEVCSEQILNRVPHLALTEPDEKFIESTAERVVRETNRVFNDGLVIDHSMALIEKTIGEALATLEKANHNSTAVGNAGVAGDVELF